MEYSKLSSCAASYILGKYFEALLIHYPLALPHILGKYIEALLIHYPLALAGLVLFVFRIDPPDFPLNMRGLRRGA